jgi:hypothetical protein
MLNQNDGVKLLKLARHTVKEYFRRGELKIKETGFNQKRGVFITIKNVDGKLRGCVGYPYPEYPLGEAIQKAAIAAAFQDSRFPPLSQKELEKILFEISVLTKPEIIEVKKPEEYLEKIKIGEDGIIVECGSQNGLLLPQVAKEHELDAEKFLSHTCLKAWLPPDKWMDDNTKIYKFQAQIFKEESSQT